MALGRARHRYPTDRLICGVLSNIKDLEGFAKSFSRSFCPARNDPSACKGCIVVKQVGRYLSAFSVTRSLKSVRPRTGQCVQLASAFSFPVRSADLHSTWTSLPDDEPQVRNPVTCRFGIALMSPDLLPTPGCRKRLGKQSTDFKMYNERGRIKSDQTPPPVRSCFTAADQAGEVRHVFPPFVAGGPGALRILGTLCRFAWLTLAVIATVASADPPVTLLNEPLDRLDKESSAGSTLDIAAEQTLENRVNSLEAELELLRGMMPQPAVIVEPACDQLGSAALPDLTHYVLYDQGWRIRPYQPKRHPFELGFQLHNQFRYTGFWHNGDAAFNSAGAPIPVVDRSTFDINRGRLVFFGYAFHPELQYYVNIDYGTVSGDSIMPLLAWASLPLGDETRFKVGMGKVPGNWEWQQTSRYTLGADRTMATTFFRPSITTGMWIDGKLTSDVQYTAFLGNGVNTLRLRGGELDKDFIYSLMTWWEPWGDFGKGFSDLEFHEEPVLRIGHALSKTSVDAASDLSPGPESTVVRLSDGTRLITPDALAVGETVNAFQWWLYAAHLGLKYRGFSLGVEYNFRWLRKITSQTGTRLTSQFDHGGFLQLGCFVVPKQLELFGRTSFVTGTQGSGDEYSLGGNWYPFELRNVRATADVTLVQDSPAQQSRTGYVVAGDGPLFRLQLWTIY